MDWLAIGRFFIKPVAIYLAALIIVRLMGKRALGQLSLFDLVIMAGIGDVIVVVGLEQRVSFQKGLIILGLIGGLELFLSIISYRSHFFARLFEGRPTLLIKDGILLEKNLAKEHISMADLRQELRKLGVAKISQVSQAIFEACGKFSVILKEDTEPISNQELLQEVKLLHQEIQELKATLQSRKED
jgi:Predicted membrane protein